MPHPALEALALSIRHARHIGLLDVAASSDFQTASAGLSPQAIGLAPAEDGPMTLAPVFGMDAPRRPTIDEGEVFAMFAQTWGSAQLGFAGLAVALITRAYTVVLRGPNGAIAVYWDGNLAYIIHPEVHSSSGYAEFTQDIANKTSATSREAVSRYGFPFSSYT